MSTGAWGMLFQNLGQGLQAYAALQQTKEQRREQQERDDRDYKLRKAQIDAQLENADLQREQLRQSMENDAVEMALKGVRTGPPPAQDPARYQPLGNDRYLDVQADPAYRALQVYKQQQDIQTNANIRERQELANRGLLWEGSGPGGGTQQRQQRLSAVNTDIDNVRARLGSKEMQLPTRPVDEYDERIPLTPQQERQFVSDSTRVAGQRRQLEERLSRRELDFTRETDAAIGRPDFTDVRGGASTSASTARRRDPGGNVSITPTSITHTPPGATGTALDSVLAKIDAGFRAGPDTPARRQKADSLRAHALRVYGR